MTAEILEMVEELAEIAYAQGHLQARLEFALQVKAIEQQEEKAPIKPTPRPWMTGSQRLVTIERNAALQAAVLDELSTDHPRAIKDVMDAVLKRVDGADEDDVRRIASVLTNKGALTRVKHGTYQRMNGHQA